MVDAPDLGSGEQLLVRVRVSPAAHLFIGKCKVTRYLIQNKRFESSKSLNYFQINNSQVISNRKEGRNAKT